MTGGQVSLLTNLGEALYSDINGGDGSATGQVIGGVAADVAIGTASAKMGQTISSLSKEASAFKSAVNVSSRGVARATTYGSSWGGESLNNAINKFAPGSKGIVNATGKVIYKNNSTGIQVVCDKNGKYFRIQDTNITAKRQYLDMNGNIPNNVKENGKLRGRSQSGYNQVTHFNDID